MGVQWQGLGQAARALRKRNMIDGAKAKKFLLLDGAHNLSKHITVLSSNEFRTSINNDLKILAETPSPAIKHVAPALADTYTAPFTVKKHVALAPDVTNSAALPGTEHVAPARGVIEDGPAPVIDYLAPAYGDTHDETVIAPAPVIGSVGTPAVFHAAPAPPVPMIEYVTSALAGIFSAPAPQTGIVTSSPAVTFANPIMWRLSQLSSIQRLLQRWNRWHRH